MKKFALLSLFNILFMLSFNASATLSWISQSEALGTNFDLSPGLSASKSSAVLGGINKIVVLSDRNLLNYLSFDNWYPNENLNRNLDNKVIMSKTQNGGIYNFRKDIVDQVSMVTTPIPAEIWLFGSALLGIGGLTSRSKRS